MSNENPNNPYPQSNQPYTQYIPNPQQPQVPYQQPNYPPQPGFQPQPPVPQPKKKSRLGLIIGVVVVVLVLYAIISATSNGAANTGSPTTTTTATTPATGATTPAKTNSKPSAAPTWQTVQTFTGNGSKKTAVFSVGDTWKIKYTCQGMGSGVDGLLAVIVYGSDNTPIDLSAVNATCTDGKTTADETIEHQGGSVYLDINAASAWTVTVQEQK